DENGELRVLSGNELGVLLADFVLERAPKRPQPLLVTSIVSTPLLEQVALERGARFERTLTGFKWIWLAAQALEASEAVRFAFGCEEALGYSTGSLVRDKDGISAAVFLCELAARCRAEGTTLLGRLEALLRRHGARATAHRSLVRPDASGISEIRDMVDRLAAAPPEVVAGTRLSAFCDYRNGADRRPVWLGRAALLELTLGPGLRVLVRPSGTEPKLKIYADAREPVQAGESGLGAAARAKEHAEAAAGGGGRPLRRTQPGWTPPRAPRSTRRPRRTPSHVFSAEPSRADAGRSSRRSTRDAAALSRTTAARDGTTRGGGVLDVNGRARAQTSASKRTTSVC